MVCEQDSEPCQTTVQFLRIQSENIYRLRSIIEAYDGLATLHGNGSGHVRLSTAASRRCELLRLLDDLRGELDFEIIR
jgi:hypothetical protein